MKKQILLIALLLTGMLSFAQELPAKMKFEEAESAYTANDYALTISKLDEAKALLKKTNPKIMSLQILAQSKIIEADPLNNFELIQQTKLLTAKYMKDYEKVVHEDQFREVYKVDSYLSDFPETKEGFEAKSNEIDNKKKEVENLSKQNEQAFMDFNYYPDYPLGLTTEEMLKRYKNYKNYKGTLINRKLDYYLPSFSTKNNKVYGYGGNLYMSDQLSDSDNPEKTAAICDKHLKSLTDQLKFAPSVKEETHSANGFNGNAKYYTWEKNGKTLTLSMSSSYDNKGLYYGFITISSTDENLAK